MASCVTVSCKSSSVVRLSGIDVSIVAPWLPMGLLRLRVGLIANSILCCANVPIIGL